MIFSVITCRILKSAVIAMMLPFFMLISKKAKSQDYAVGEGVNFINFETGFMNDGYRSLGIRVFAEYRREFRTNWSIAVGLDNSFHLTQFPIVEPGEGSSNLVDLPVNLNILTFSGYYNLPFRDNKFYLRPGIGISGVMVRWDGHQETGVAVNFNLPLGIRVSPNVYITTSILPILFPFNRLYISGIKIETFDNFHAFSLLPIGVDVRF